MKPQHVIDAEAAQVRAHLRGLDALHRAGAAEDDQDREAHGWTPALVRKTDPEPSAELLAQSRRLEAVEQASRRAAAVRRGLRMARKGRGRRRR